MDEYKIRPYQKVLKFDIPNPTHQTVAPELHDSKSCDSSTFSRTTVACLKGQCNMPRASKKGVFQPDNGHDDDVKKHTL